MQRPWPELSADTTSFSRERQAPILESLDKDMQLAAFNADHEASGSYTLHWAEDLAEIKRFGAEAVMVHRPDLLTHSLRVRSLAYLLAEHLEHQETYSDYVRLGHLALSHDNPEVITGDIPSPEKSVMSLEEKARLRSQELVATHRLSKRYVPEEFRGLYLDLHHEVSEKKTVEAQVVKVADVWDGLCETLNEIRCGNDAFYPVLENYRKIFENLHEYEPWQGVASFFGFDDIPTRKEAGRMPRVSRRFYHENREVFWQNTLSAHLPGAFQAWTRVSLSLSAESQNFLYPGWNDIPEHEAEWATI